MRGMDPPAGPPITLDWLRSEAKTWWVTEPDLLRRERGAMAALSTELVWTDVQAGGWYGPVPGWPFDRPAPDGFESFLPWRLVVAVVYDHAFPMIEPRVLPLVHL